MLYLDIGITREATLKQRLLSLAAKNYHNSHVQHLVKKNFHKINEDKILLLFQDIKQYTYISRIKSKSLNTVKHA